MERHFICFELKVNENRKNLICYKGIQNIEVKEINEGRIQLIFSAGQDNNTILNNINDFLSLNKKIEGVVQKVRTEIKLDITKFGVYDIGVSEVALAFRKDEVIICKKDASKESINISYSNKYLSKESGILTVSLKTIAAPDFNLLDHVHIVKKADLKKDIQDKLLNQENYLVDINYKKKESERYEIEITPRNKSISKHKILIAKEINDDIVIFQNDRKISILLPVRKLLEKAECDYVKFFERDKNKEFAALIGVITFGISAISTTILLYSFIQKQNKFIIYETSVLLLEVLLAVCASMCFYTYRDEKLTQIELSEINRGGM